MATEQSDAEAGRAMDFPARMLVWSGQGFEHLPTDRLGLYRGLGGFRAEVLQHHHELVAAEARQAVSLANDLVQASGHLDQ